MPRLSVVHRWLLATQYFVDIIRLAATKTVKPSIYDFVLVNPCPNVPEIATFVHGVEINIATQRRCIICHNHHRSNISCAHHVQPERLETMICAGVQNH